MTPSPPSLPVLFREALPTSRHARMCFDMVADHLGRRAHLDRQAGGTLVRLFVREAEGSPSLVPWPLLTLSLVAPQVIDLSADGWGEAGLAPVPGRPPRPGPIPRLRNLGPGEITIHDGPAYLRVAYDEDGRWKETSQSRDIGSLEPARAALAAGGGTPAELLAAWVASLDVACHGAGRLYFPVPTAGGAEGVFRVGLAALREALFDHRIPREAAWAVADGVQGSALAWGATREEAEEAWAHEVARVRPTPPPPRPPPEPDFGSEDASAAVHFDRPADDAALIRLTSETIPRVTVRLAPVPEQRSPFGVWLRMLSARGEGRLGAIRHEPRGYTLLGELVLARTNLADLDRRLAALSLAPHAEHFPDTRNRTPPYDTRVVAYLFADPDTGADVPPRITTCSLGPAFPARGLDPDALRGQVLRLRRVDPQDPWRA